ncbi:hypothetical protein BDQ17DRAFT_1360016, partial [Cyathus striatus]
AIDRRFSSHHIHPTPTTSLHLHQRLSSSSSPNTTYLASSSGTQNCSLYCVKVFSIKVPKLNDAFRREMSFLLQVMGHEGVAEPKNAFTGRLCFCSCTIAAADKITNTEEEYGFIVTQFYNYPTLSAFLDAGAVGWVHSKGVFLRTLAASNVLVDATEGKVRIVDFEGATGDKVDGAGLCFTSQGLSPRQIDLKSLGSILRLLLSSTGALPDGVSQALNVRSVVERVHKIEEEGWFVDMGDFAPKSEDGYVEDGVSSLREVLHDEEIRDEEDAWTARDDSKKISMGLPNLREPLRSIQLAPGDNSLDIIFSLRAKQSGQEDTSAIFPSPPPPSPSTLSPPPTSPSSSPPPPPSYSPPPLPPTSSPSKTSLLRTNSPQSKSYSPPPQHAIPSSAWLLPTQAELPTNSPPPQLFTPINRLRPKWWKDASPSTPPTPPACSATPSPPPPPPPSPSLLLLFPPSYPPPPSASPSTTAVSSGIALTTSHSNSSILPLRPTASSSPPLPSLVASPIPVAPSTSSPPDPVRIPRPHAPSPWSASMHYTTFTSVVGEMESEPMIRPPTPRPLENPFLPKERGAMDPSKVVSACIPTRVVGSPLQVPIYSPQPVMRPSSPLCLSLLQRSKGWNLSDCPPTPMPGRNPFVRKDTMGMNTPFPPTSNMACGSSFSRFPDPSTPKDEVERQLDEDVRSLENNIAAVGEEFRKIFNSEWKMKPRENEEEREEWYIVPLDRQTPFPPKNIKFRPAASSTPKRSRASKPSPKEQKPSISPTDAVYAGSNASVDVSTYSLSRIPSPCADAIAAEEHRVVVPSGDEQVRYPRGEESFSGALPRGRQPQVWEEDDPFLGPPRGAGGRPLIPYWLPPVMPK